MRRFAISLFLVILASLIFYGGAGVNFVSYCCGVCEKEGVEALLEAKCCEIHGHDHSRDKLANNTVECCGMNGCGIERVDFDWNSVNIQVPDLQPVVHDLLFSSIFESLQIASLFADSYEIRVTGPPVACPRVYLSLLTTLLI